MRSTVIVAILLCFASASFSQSTGIRGRILDRQGAVITGATITATDSTKRAIQAISNTEGEYKFEVQPGEYVLFVGDERTLFCQLRIKNFLVPKFNGYVHMDIILKKGMSSHNGDSCKLKTIEF